MGAGEQRAWREARRNACVGLTGRSSFEKRAFFFFSSVAASAALILRPEFLAADGCAPPGMPVFSSAPTPSLTGERAPLFLRMSCSIFLARGMRCSSSLPVGWGLLTSAKNLV